MYGQSKAPRRERSVRGVAVAPRRHDVDQHTAARDLFMQQVRQTPDCWEWTGWTSGTKPAYGVIEIEGHRTSAHRLSYILHIGPVPEGRVVRRSCDNHMCVNPD